MYIGGYNPMVILEGLLNMLVAKGIISSQEAQALIAKAKAPNS